MGKREKQKTLLLIQIIRYCLTIERAEIIPALRYLRAPSANREEKPYSRDLVI